MNKKIKKKIRLKNPRKTILTLFIIAICPLVYKTVGFLGESVMKSDWALFFVILGWFWLVIGQPITLSFIWED